MHNKIDYTNMLDKERAARLDFVQYLGYKKSRILIKIIYHTNTLYGEFEAWCGFAGVSGYPVKAMWNKYHGKSPDPSN